MRLQSWIAFSLAFLLVIFPGPVSAGSLPLSVEPQQVTLSGASACRLTATASRLSEPPAQGKDQSYSHSATTTIVICSAEGI